MSLFTTTAQADVIFIRHGETQWNLAGILQGWQDSTLTPLGRKQVKHSAKRLSYLKSPRPIAIYTSDLGRAMASARIVARTINGHLVVDTRLRERGFGELEGRPVVLAQDASLAATFEPEDKYRLRIQHYLDSLQQHIKANKTRHQNTRSPIVVIGHGQWIKSCLTQLTKGDFNRLPANGELLALRFPDLS
jgi:probable phosphoglycerate mutase